MTNSPLAAVAKGIWWAVLLRGIFAVIFGIIALAAPGAALTGVVFVFGIYAIVDGVTAVIHAVQIRTPGSGWGWLLFQGAVSIIAGVVALIFPVLAGVIGGLFALWTIVIYAVMHGALGIGSAAGLADGRNRTIGIVSGVLTLAFGILLGILTLATPGATVLSLIWIVGIYAIVFGVMFIIAAIQLRRGVTTLLGQQSA
ncbi:Uncharacterized membrane protein HdeD, DUF308 family [Agreia bicolorata]|uniref:Uncharacterized membrane protein HdeD, DUF308 family n=1 Tax=Agreia bicolorata TaxID=110935 RepID=A0A1T4YBM4_9MICO|nr:DUF308 domain-containing protein [Agreia bicolorata]SKA99083.1 Uncharacterized membrane protein HdeD, DUF308 family [Agreia bicolorata]